LGQFSAVRYLAMRSEISGRQQDPAIGDWRTVSTVVSDSPPTQIGNMRLLIGRGIESEVLGADMLTAKFTTSGAGCDQTSLNIRATSPAYSIRWSYRR